MIIVNIIKPINEIILKKDTIEVLIDKKNVELLTIDKVILKETLNSDGYYNKQDVDNKLDGKIDVPTPEEWQQIELILIS